MKITITEFQLYELFKKDDVNGMIEIFDTMRFDGRSDFLYDHQKESFLRYLLGIAVAHANANHLSNYMLNQLIERVSMCCNVVYIARLAIIAADIKPSDAAAIPEKVHRFLNVDTYSKDELSEAVDKFSKLDKQEMQALLCYLAEEIKPSFVPPLRFNAPILKRAYICGLLPAGTLLAIMATALLEASSKTSSKKSLIKRLFG